MPVGQEIICFCSSCKLELRHVIVAHKSGNSGSIAKVRCNTCNKIHAYRATPTEKAAAAAVARKQSGKPVREKVQVIPVEVEWREQLSKVQNVASQNYVPTMEFKVGDVIEHPTFGCGIVRTLKDGNKFEVLFQRDVKTLIHKLKEA
ncbi:MAG TPA: hypothetical protein VIH99_09195 [Bdellovibrionota bacterium]|jgi:hypothetical protein